MNKRSEKSKLKTDSNITNTSKDENARLKRVLIMDDKEETLI